MRELALFGFAAWAAWRTRRMPLFCAYFCILAANDLVLEECLYLYGYTSQTYTVAYALCVFSSLVVASAMSWSALERFVGTGKLMLSVAALSAFWVESAGKVASLPLRVIEIEIGWFYIVGILMLGAGMLAARHNKVYLAIGGLWFTQSLFFWEYRWHAPEMEWIERGFWVPALMCCAGFFLIGMLAGREEPLC